MSTTRKTLGRGLGELMAEVSEAEVKPISPVQAASDRGFQQIPVEDLSPADDAPLPSAGAWDSLERSIRDHGVLQALLVRRTGTGYEVLDGRKRLRVARDAGLNTLPCLVVSSAADAGTLADAANIRPQAPEPPRAIPVAAESSVVFTPAAAIRDWRTDWRLPAAFAAVAGIGLALGIFGALRLSPAELPPQTQMSQAPIASQPPEPAPAVSPDAVDTLPVVDGVPGIPVPAQGASLLDSLQLEGVTLSESEGAVKVVFDGPVFSRYATISAGAGNVLRQLAEKLKGLGGSLAIRVRGHTDDAPITSGAYRDNYALGMARAVRVVEFLRNDCGLTDAAFSASSDGEANPVYPNDTPADRVKNRTVTLELETTPSADGLAR